MTVRAMEPAREMVMTDGSLLMRLVALCIMGLPLLGLTSPSDFPSDVRALAGVTWVLCTLPLLIYVSSSPERRRPIPALGVFGLTYGYFFTFHIVSGVETVWPVYFTISAATDFGKAVQYVLVGWVATVAAYVLTTLFFWRTPARWSKRVYWDLPRLKYAAFLMLFATIPVNALYSLVGRNFVVGNLVMLASRFELFGMALLIALLFRGKLNPREGKLLWAGVGIQAVLSISSGSVANLALRFLIIGVSAWMGGARATIQRVVLIVVAVTSLVVFRGLIKEFRDKTWFGSQQMTLPAKVQLWGEIVTNNIRSQGVLGTLSHSWEVVAGRTNHLTLLADVTVKTPSVVAYWGGKTYISLLGSFVPRALWPNKPEKRLGQDFGHRYGYLTQNDMGTSFNLPYLVEFYANFGEIGVLVGMLVVGMIFGMTDSLFNRQGQPLAETALGIGLTLPLITHLESDFSLTFGGLVLNGAAAVAVLLLTQRYAEAKSPAASSGATRSGDSPPRTGGNGREPILRRA
jgi:hypothetical protein